MQVSVEPTEGLERKMTIGVPADRVESEVESRLKRYARTARIKGFRPGKAPLKVLRQQYGAGVRQEVLGEVMSQSFYEAVTQEKLRPAGRPTIEPTRMDEGADVEFVATFEVYPEITLGDLSAIQVKRPVVEIQPADVDAMIERLREQQADWTDVERAAAEGDRVTMDFEGTIDGESFEGGSGQDTPLVLGSGQMIDGFEDGLVGAAPGEERTLDLVFPREYAKEALQGKPVQFHVTVKSVAEKALPELGEAFFQRFGVTEGGLEAFRAEVEANMARELKQAVESRIKNQIMDGLLAQNEDLSVPSALVEQEIDTLRRQAVQQFGGGQQLDPSMLPGELFQDQAERRVRLGLIVAQLVDEKSLEADPDKVRARIEDMASAYESPEQVVEYLSSNREQRAAIESLVLEDAVIETVLAEGDVSDEPMDYETLMNPAPEQSDK